MLYAGRDGKYLKFRCPRHAEAMGGPCSTYGRVLKVAISENERRWPGLAKTTVNANLSLLVMVGGALAMARNKKMDNLRQIVALAA